MTREKWRDLLESVGFVAIIASLVLVADELRQGALIARAELVVESYIAVRAIHGTLASDTDSGTYAKMIEGAEELSLQEMVQIDHLLSQVVSVFAQERYLHGLGIFTESEDVIRWLTPQFFGNRYAQEWWSENRARWEAGLVELVDEEMKKISASGDKKYYEKIKSNM